MHLLIEALWTAAALVAIFGLVFILAVVEARMFDAVLTDVEEEEPEVGEFEPLRQAA